MIKKILVFALALCATLALAVPCFAATDSGAVYGRYDMALPSSFGLPDINSTNVPVTGSFIADGVEYTLYSIQVSRSGVKFFNAPSGALDVYNVSSGFLVSSLSVNLDTYQLNLTRPADLWLFDWLRVSDWLDGPEPFPDSISAALAAVIASLGDVLVAVTIANGALAPLLPLLGISIAVSIALLVFLIIKRSTTT